MNFQDLAELTGFASRKISRARRLMSLAIAAMVVLIVSSGVSGYILYMQIIDTYEENYARMVEAGFDNVLVAPEVISQNLLFVLSVAPFISVALVMPIFYFATKEICHLYEEFRSRDSSK